MQRGTFSSSDESDTNHNLIMRASCQVKDQTGTNFGKRIFGPDDGVSQVRLGMPCMNHILGPRVMQESYRVGWPLVDQNPVSVNQFRKQVSDEENIFHLSGSPVSLLHLVPSSNVYESNVKLPAAEVNEYNATHGLEVKQQRQRRLLPLLPQPSAENSPDQMALNSEHLHAQNDEKATGISNCKLFGISLTSNPVVQELVHSNSTHKRQGQTDVALEHHQDMGSELLEHVKCSRVAETATGRDEQVKSFQVSKQLPVDGFVKLPGGSTRSSIKVIYCFIGYTFKKFLLELGLQICVAVYD